MNTFLLSALLPVALCQPAFADVNMRDGSFIQTWTDFRWTDSYSHRSLTSARKTNSLFDLNRTYNSRSLRQGLFGFGWCSEIETTLRWQGGQVFISDCEGTRKISVSQKDHFWWTELATGGFQKFNGQGRLVAWKESRKSPLIQFSYRGELLSRLSFSQSEIVFLYEPSSQQLKAIEAFQSGTQVFHKDYQFENKNLVSVGKNRLSKISYQYDDFHNLIRWSDSNFDFHMTYDVPKDQIQKVESSNGCQEKYTYQKLSPTTFQSQVQRSCPHEKPLTKLWQFQAAKQRNQKLRLESILISENNRPLQPIRVGDNNDFKSLP